MIFGINLGSILTESLVGLKTGKKGQRIALSLLLFKLTGIGLFLLFFNQFIFFLSKFFSGENQILASHFFFNLLVVFVFFLFLRPFARLIRKIIPSKEKENYLWPAHLRKDLLKSPNLVFEALRKEFLGLLGLIKKMFEESKENISDFSKRKYDQVIYQEIAVDNIQDEILKFLDKLPKEKLKIEQVKKMIDYAEATDEIERIADRIVNLNKLASHKKINKVVFSEEAQAELEDLFSLTLDNVLLLEESILENKVFEEKEDFFEEKIEESKRDHLQRFSQRKVATADASIFNHLLINLKEIDEHLKGVGQLISYA